MNKFGRVKHCPYCHGDVRLAVNWLPFPAFALLNIPFATILQTYLMDNGLSRFVAYIIAYLPLAALWLLFGFKLKPIRSAGRDD